MLRVRSMYHHEEGCPIDKNEGAVKDKDILSGAEHRFFAREVEDQDSGNENLTLITHGGRSFHPPSIRPNHQP